MAIIRVVESELLDTLDAGDPEALRSRRDLRMINALMGNQIWFLRQFRKLPPSSFAGIVEIGAGEGCLSRAIHRRYPSIPLTAMDLQPGPPAWAESFPGFKATSSTSCRVFQQTSSSGG